MTDHAEDQLIELLVNCRREQRVFIKFMLALNSDRPNFRASPRISHPRRTTLHSS